MPKSMPYVVLAVSVLAAGLKCLFVVVFCQSRTKFSASQSVAHE